MTYAKHTLKTGNVAYLTRNGSGDYHVTVNGPDGSAYTMHPSYSEAQSEYVKLIASDKEGAA